MLLNRGLVGSLVAVAGLLIVLVFSGPARATNFCGCGPKKDNGICDGKSQGSACGDGLICNLSTARKCAGNPAEFFCACSLNDSKLEVEPTDLNFGNVDLSKHAKEKSKHYKIKNPGHVNLTVTIGMGTIPGFSFVEHSGLVIGPHKSEKFGVTFAPHSAGDYSGEIPITGNPGIGSSSAEVALSGSASGSGSTATRTPTPTPTATATATPTSTATATSSATVTSTATRTATATATSGGTATATTTATPTTTATATPVPASYSTCTNTFTASFQRPSVAVSGNNVAVAGLDGANLTADISSDGGQTFGSMPVTLAADTDSSNKPQCKWLDFKLECAYYTGHDIDWVSYDTSSKTVSGPNGAISTANFPTFLPYGGLLYVAGTNGDGVPFTQSTDGATWSALQYPFGQGSNFAVPTLAGGIEGIAVTGGGLAAGGLQDIVGSMYNGSSFSAPFNIFTAATENDAVFFGPPNTFMANKLLVIFGADTNASSGFVFSAYGDVSVSKPTFTTTQIATGYSPIEGFLVNPPATLAAAVGISLSNGWAAVYQGDVTIPSSFTSMELNNVSSLQIAADGNTTQGIFAVTTGATSTRIYRCAP